MLSLFSCGKKSASDQQTDTLGIENMQGISDSIATAGDNTQKSSETVIIGAQEWMTGNLKVTKFRNGDPIPQAKTNEEWAEATQEGTPAWCFYGNHSNLDEWYGKLYNWYAVIDPRGLAPAGWHVPGAQEWDQMADFLGYDVSAKLKSSGGWDEENNGTNESGFNGLPGGFRYADGHDFLLFGIYGVWWTASEAEGNQAEARHLAIFNPEMLWQSDADGIGRFYVEKGYGFSVRCIKGGNTEGQAGEGMDIPDQAGQIDVAGEALNISNMLQGKWQSTEDASNYLVFEGNVRKEIAEGIEEWRIEEFILSDKCMNESDKGGYTTGEKGRYISVLKSNTCWYIVELDDSRLLLSYVGRGNTLTYRRVE
jgi:uncharacterized protein (TIGR02145 family)